MKPCKLAIFLLSMAALPALAGNPDDCAQLERLQRGKNCGKAESVEITLTNACGKPMDLRFCLETGTRKWNCGLQFAVPPGKPVNWLNCEGTGRHQLWARTPKANAPFPEEHGAYRSAGRALFAVASGETQASACKRASDMAGASGECECEAVDANGEVIRCRVPAAFEAGTPTGASIRAFEPAMFAALATAQNKDQACAQARQLAESPDGACACQNKAGAHQCRVTASKIRSPSLSLREQLLNELRCDPQRDANCVPGKPGGGGSSGIRD